MAEKTVLIGANGFLGRALAAADPTLLTLRRADVDLLDGTLPIIEAALGADLLIDAADFYPGIRYAAAAPSALYSKNVRMYENLFAFAAAHQIPKVVTIGTTACYPISDRPLRETMFDGDVGALNPQLRGYAASRFTLLDIAALYRQEGIVHSHLILPNFYGPGDKYAVGASHLLASWIRDFAAAQEARQRVITLWGPPSQQREFIFIDDAAAYVLALTRLEVPEILNVGTGTAPAYDVLARSVLAALSYNCEIKWDLERPPARMREIMDRTLLASCAPNLPVPTPFATALVRTVEAYLHER